MDAFKVKKSVPDIVQEVLGYVAVVTMWIGMLVMFVVLA